MAFEPLDSRMLLSGFAPDPGFGQGGFVATLGGLASENSIALAPNGKIVELATIDGQSSVLRFNADGTPDTTFGNQGVAPSPIDAAAVAVQSDGSIVIGGTSHPGLNQTSFAVARLSPNGTIDTTFGTNGEADLHKVTLGTDSVSSLAIDGQGRIVLVGGEQFDSSPLLLAGRVDAKGQIDPSFGQEGLLVESALPPTRFLPMKVWNDVLLQPDGKILIAGYVPGPVVRLDADGHADPTFNGTSPSSANDPASFVTATSVLLQPDGKILLLAPSFASAFATPTGDGGIVRLNIDGSTDTSFGVGGLGRWLSPIVPTGFALQADSHIVMAGYTLGDSPQGLLVGFLPDGRPDPTRHDFITAQTTGTVIAQPDGKLLVGGVVTPAGTTGRYGVIVRETVSPAADANVQYVSQLYADLLNRLPDDPGLQFYVTELQQGLSRGLVAQQLLSSDESLTRQITAQYQNVFGRTPDAPGLQHWLDLLHSGGTIVEVEAGLLGSPEFASGSTDSEFLTALYQKVLGRAVDPVGQASFGQALASGTSRGDVALALLRSRESATNRVQAYYHAYLRRGADPDGLAHWVDVFLASGGDDEPVADGLLATDEYLAILRYPAPI